MQKILPILIISILIYSCSEEKISSINIIDEDGIIKWKEKEKCLIQYFNGSNELLIPAKIKYRGGMSSRYNKHSYALELDNKINLAGLPIDDDWVLNANYIDKTFMRHKISYDIFCQMSPFNIAPKSTYINVSLNNKYEGLYLLTEEINGAMVNLNKTDSLSMIFKDPPIFYKEQLSYVQDSLNYYQQKYPKISKEDKTAYIKKFKSFLFDTNNEEFTKEINNWVDISNIIDWHIILMFTNNGDGIMKNFYLYKLDRQTPFRFAIWDYDHSFGRDGDNELNIGGKPLMWERSILLKRLFEINEINYISQLKTRWNELRKQNIISLKNFKKHVHKNDQIINKSLELNFKKWPVNDKWYYDENTYPQEIDLMLCFVEQRIEKLDKYMSNLNHHKLK